MRPNLELLASRQASWLTGTGTVTRPGSGQPVFDPDTGDYEHPPPVTAYDGPLLVQPQSNAERVIEAGEASFAVTRYDVTLPARTDVKRGDTVTVTDAPFDPALVGVQLTVLDVPLDVWQVARRAVAARVT